MRIRAPESDSESHIHLDFVPMADTLFNLLIFFLLAATIAQVEREMSVALPYAASAMPISVAMRELTINVDQAGEIHVGGNKIDAEQLREIVKQSVAANPEQKVTVRGDRRTAYANVVTVLDICKGSGIQEPYLDTIMEH